MTRRLDILPQAGCRHYMAIDPADALVRIWELASGAYHLVVHAHGDQRVTVSRPVEPAEQAALKCLYLITRGPEPKGFGPARRIVRRRPVLNTFADHMRADETL